MTYSRVVESLLSPNMTERQQYHVCLCSLIVMSCTAGFLLVELHWLGLSPLLYLQASSELQSLPPAQAAFLDLKLAGVLGELLGRLVPVLGQGADAGSLCTMVLEAILTLQDPETCLNPMAPALQRVPDETPAPNEASCSAQS